MVAVIFQRLFRNTKIFVCRPPRVFLAVAPQCWSFDLWIDVSRQIFLFSRLSFTLNITRFFEPVRQVQVQGSGKMLSEPDCSLSRK